MPPFAPKIVIDGAAARRHDRLAVLAEPPALLRGDRLDDSVAQDFRPDGHGMRSQTPARIALRQASVSGALGVGDDRRRREQREQRLHRLQRPLEGRVERDEHDVRPRVGRERDRFLAEAGLTGEGEPGSAYGLLHVEARLHILVDDDR